MYLNRAFFDNPLLPALNVSVQHASAYHGRSKPCERLFGIFEGKYISQLPGWTGHSIDTRPFDFSKELARLKRTGDILSLEDFVRLWDEVIVPDYHTNSYENPSAPMDRYLAFPKADTLTPDWNTLAAFKTEKHKRRVQQNGIHYNNDIYWHPVLADYIKKDVVVCDFDTSFFHSISVLYENRFICEARPAIHFDMLESDKLKLKLHLEEQRAQYRKLTRRIFRIKFTLSSAGLPVERYDDTSLEKVDEKDLDAEPILGYGPAIDFEQDRTQATMISAEASELGKVAV